MGLLGVGKSFHHLSHCLLHYGGLFIAYSCKNEDGHCLRRRNWAEVIPNVVVMVMKELDDNHTVCA